MVVTYINDGSDGEKQNHLGRPLDVTNTPVCKACQTSTASTHMLPYCRKTTVRPQKRCLRALGRAASIHGVQVVAIGLIQLAAAAASLQQFGESRMPRSLPLAVCHPHVRNHMAKA
jgi:hypothetical protein